jgi:hypothetical protein
MLESLAQAMQITESLHVNTPYRKSNGRMALDLRLLGWHGRSGE